METFRKDPFETVKARIVSDNERQVMGSWQGVVVEAMGQRFLDERDWVILGSGDFSEVGGVNVEVVRMVTDVMPSSGEGVRDGTLG